MQACLSLDPSILFNALFPSIAYDFFSVDDKIHCETNSREEKHTKLFNFLPQLGLFEKFLYFTPSSAPICAILRHEKLKIAFENFPNELPRIFLPRNASRNLNILICSAISFSRMIKFWNPIKLEEARKMVFCQSGEGATSKINSSKIKIRKFN